MTHPTGYRGPHDPGRDPNLVMQDPVAQNLIADIVTLYEALCVKLTQDIHLAGLGPANPQSGFVTGTNDHDQMLNRATAITQAQAEQARTLKNVRQRLRRDIRYLEDRLGVPCADPAHYHTIDVSEAG